MSRRDCMIVARLRKAARLSSPKSYVAIAAVGRASARLRVRRSLRRRPGTQCLGQRALNEPSRRVRCDRCGCADRFDDWPDVIAEQKNVMNLCCEIFYLEYNSLYGEHLLVPEYSLRFQHKGTCSGRESTSGIRCPRSYRTLRDGFFLDTFSQALRARSPSQTTAHPKPCTCATNRCDRDVGLAESGYDRCVPMGRGLQLFRNRL